MCGAWRAPSDFPMDLQGIARVAVFELALRAAAVFFRRSTPAGLTTTLTRSAGPNSGPALGALSQRIVECGGHGGPREDERQ